MKKTTNTKKKTHNNTKEIKPNKFDLLVLEYRAADKRADLNRIFKELRKIYLYKLYDNMSTYNTRHHHDIISNYDLYLLQCINRWSGENGKGDYCSFSTYAYPWLVRKPFSSLLEGNIKKERREVASGTGEEIFGLPDDIFGNENTYDEDRDYNGFV